MTATATLFNLATASLSPTAINLGEGHVGGGVSQALTLVNTAATGNFSENLDASFSGASGLTDSGSVALLKAGLSSTALGITLAGTSAGTVSGAATVTLTSDGTSIDTLGTTALPSQTVTATATLFNLATASLSPTAINLGQHHVGGALTQALTLANTAATGSFSENLDAGFSGASGLTDSGSVSLLKAGLSSTALGITLAGTSAGTVSGAATVTLTSDGTSIDTLGTTTLTSQTVTATATLFNLATASLSPTAINLGQHHVGGALTQALTLANTAATGSFSENLDAGFSGASGLTDSGSVALLKAGLSSTALGITLAGTSAGTVSGAATVTLTSDGTSIDTLGTTTLTSQAVTATATLFNLATASLSPTAINLGQHHVGGALTQALTLANTAATGSFSENLDAGFSGASGLTDSGSVSLLKAGLSSTALGITLAGTSAGTVSGAATVTLTSDGTSIDTLGTTGLGTEQVTVTATFFNLATVSLSPTAINLGQHHVGGALTQALTLANTAPAGAFTENVVATVDGVSGGVISPGTQTPHDNRQAAAVRHSA